MTRGREEDAGLDAALCRSKVKADRPAHSLFIVPVVHAIAVVNQGVHSSSRTTLGVYVSIRAYLHKPSSKVYESC